MYANWDPGSPGQERLTEVCAGEICALQGLPFTRNKIGKTDDTEGKSGSHADQSCCLPVICQPPQMFNSGCLHHEVQREIVPLVEFGIAVVRIRIRLAKKYRSVAQVRSSHGRTPAADRQHEWIALDIFRPSVCVGTLELQTVGESAPDLSLYRDMVRMSLRSVIDDVAVSWIEAAMRVDSRPSQVSGTINKVRCD